MGLFDLLPNSQNKDKNALQRKAKILVADDEKYLNDFYVELLTAEGYELLSAFNGQEAIDMVMKSLPDLVILDLNMPLLNGEGVLKRMRENEKTKEIPVIILTNDANIETVTEVKLHHANRYFTKSNIEPPKLIEAIHTLLNQVP